MIQIHAQVYGIYTGLLVDPSAAPPPLFRLARGAPTKIRLAAAGDFSGGGGGIRRDLVNGGTSHY